MQNHETSKCSRSAIETFGNAGELRYNSGPFEKNVGCQKYVHHLSLPILIWVKESSWINPITKQKQ